MNDEVMVVNYVTQMEVEEVFLRDFPHEAFAKAGYTIVRLKNGPYGIVKNGNLEEIFTKFDKPNELKVFREDVYLIYLENGLQKFMLVEPEGKVIFSETFKEIKKIFRKYILVEFETGKRALTDCYRYGVCFKFFEWEKGMCASSNGHSTNHAILELPNGKYTILTKDDLNYNGLEFENVHNFFCEKTNNLFRIVRLEREKSVVVRISDLKVSKPYFIINHLSYGDGHYSKKYVKVHSENSKYDAILRVSDFEVSKEYENLLGIDRDFAVFEENGNRNILRLADFKEAKWEDE